MGTCEEGVMRELGDGELQLEERAFQLLFAAVGLHLLIESSSATENVEVCAGCESLLSLSHV